MTKHFTPLVIGFIVQEGSLKHLQELLQLMIRCFIIFKECMRWEKHFSSLNILETSVVPQMVAVLKGTYHISRVATKNAMAQSYMKTASKLSAKWF
jgi:hypothetical protein